MIKSDRLTGTTDNQVYNEAAKVFKHYYPTVRVAKAAAQMVHVIRCKFKGTQREEFGREVEKILGGRRGRR